MTAMGIIGIVLVSLMTLVLIGAAAYAAYVDMQYTKTKQTQQLIEYAALVYKDTTSELIHEVIQDSVNALPEMAKAMSSALTNDDE